MMRWKKFRFADLRLCCKCQHSTLNTRNRIHTHIETHIEMSIYVHDALCRLIKTQRMWRFSAYYQHRFHCAAWKSAAVAATIVNHCKKTRIWPWWPCGGWCVCMCVCVTCNLLHDLLMYIVHCTCRCCCCTCKQQFMSFNVAYVQFMKCKSAGNNYKLTHVDCNVCTSLCKTTRNGNWKCHQLVLRRKPR